jgi:hypothetical protein
MTLTALHVEVNFRPFKSTLFQMRRALSGTRNPRCMCGLHPENALLLPQRTSDM